VFAHDHPHEPIFDPDNLDDFDWDFVNTWWHALLAVLSMIPAYFIFFAASPIMFPLIGLGLGYLAGRWTFRHLRRQGLWIVQLVVGVLLGALRALMRLAR
jgi:hypothetical protein